MDIFSCPKGCCTVKIKLYNKSKDPFGKVRRQRRKAGVFFYDPKSDKVLLIQSRGHLWGPPKGTLNYAETERNCAVREVQEETGLVITPNDFTRATVIKNRAMYFYVEKHECDVQVQDTPDNDANGITWIKLDCLDDCIRNGNISVTQHCRIVFYRFMNKRILPHSTFIVVERKKRSSRF